MNCLSIFTTTFVLLALGPIRVAADDLVPARVKIAYGESFSPGGGFSAISRTIVEVKVKNVAYDKEVVMHYRPGSGAWQDFAIAHAGWYGNYDVFRAAAPVTDEFVIKYTTAGTTYWDNAGGANYKVGTFKGIVGGDVMLKEALARTFEEDILSSCRHRRWFEGEIFVQNRSYHKRVGVRFTRDGGTSWQEADGFYAGKQPALGGLVDDIEIWRFKIPDEACPPHHPDPNYRFAVFYQVTQPGPDLGKQFWDNNFGQDYTLPKVDGSTIR